MTTREKITETADTLFYEQGFAATSFADISAAVGISRGNFYYHFKTKDQILEAVIAHRMSKTRAMLQDWEDETTPATRIIGFVGILTTNQSRIMAFGCPVGTLSTELAKLDHQAVGAANQIFDLFKDWLTDQFFQMGDQDYVASALRVLSWSQGVAAMATAFRDVDYIETEVARMSDWVNARQA